LANGSVHNHRYSGQIKLQPALDNSIFPCRIEHSDITDL